MIANTVPKKHFLHPKERKGNHRARFQHVAPALQSKSVLDIGAGSDHWRDDWFHQMIHEVASEVVGVELDESYIEAARLKGIGHFICFDKDQRIFCAAYRNIAQSAE